MDRPTLPVKVCPQCLGSMDASEFRHRPYLMQGRRRMYFCSDPCRDEWNAGEEHSPELGDVLEYGFALMNGDGDD